MPKFPSEKAIKQRKPLIIELLLRLTEITLNPGLLDIMIHIGILILILLILILITV